MRPRQPLSPDARRRGLTLLEVLVAAVVLAAGAAMVLEALAAGRRSLLRAASDDQAIHLAAGQLARVSSGEIRALPAEGEARIGGVVYRWALERSTQEGALSRVVCRVSRPGEAKRPDILLERLVLEGVGP